jgi:outer membrane protein assembly factor BamB
MKHLLPLVLVLCGWAAAPAAENWSFWRGPEQNGVSRERGLPDKFSPRSSAEDSNVLWRVPYGGICTPIVQNGRVYVITKTGSGESAPGKTGQEAVSDKPGEGLHQQEVVLCFDAGSGKLRWEHKFNVFLTDIVRDRLGWTHMVGDPETGNVYAHGTQGFFFCFSSDGKILWQHSLTEEYGRVSGYGGRVTSPIVEGDLVILGLVNASWGEQTVGETRFVAFDKRKGDIVWWAHSGYRVKDTYYSTPVVAVIGGQRLLISGAGDGGVHAFKVRTGEKVWSYIFGDGAVNCSPVVQGDRVYIGHGEENENNTQGRVICVDGATVENGKPKLVWQVDGIKAKFAAPVLHEGRLYIPNEAGVLFCLDAGTGKELWYYEYGKNTKGSPVWADGKIYITEVDSRFHILKPTDKGCEELANVFFRSRGVVPVELNDSPAIAGGRIYFMTSTELLCVGKKDQKAEPDKIPAPPAEAVVPPGARPAHLQVVPADVELTPGKSVELKARAFDDHGRLLGEVKVDWSLAGPLPPVFGIGFPPQPKPAQPPAAPPPLQGVLSAKAGMTTRLTVAKAPPGQFGRVVATLNGLTGYARVRVAPVLPYPVDFAKVPEGRTPGGWVNTQGKFAVKALPGGAKVLAKRNDAPSPLIARAHAFIGMPDLTDYTIQADVQGSKVRTDLPDMGVSANRYTLMLAGNLQQLRLVSWDAQPRVDKNIDWPWKPGVWYCMKLTVTVKGDKALVRGKVWPRDQKEPGKWSVEFTDPCPNREGSPSLYGYSTGILSPTSPGTEIYYDKVRITPNK